MSSTWHICPRCFARSVRRVPRCTLFACAACHWSGEGSLKVRGRGFLSVQQFSARASALSVRLHRAHREAVEGGVIDAVRALAARSAPPTTGAVVREYNARAERPLTHRRIQSVLRVLAARGVVVAAPLRLGRYGTTTLYALRGAENSVGVLA